MWDVLYISHTFRFCHLKQFRGEKCRLMTRRELLLQSSKRNLHFWLWLSYPRFVGRTRSL